MESGKSRRIVRIADGLAAQRFANRSVAYRLAFWPRSALRLRFSADALLKSAIIFLLLSAVGVVCRWRSLELPSGDVWSAVGLLGGLLGLAAYYRGRREQTFVLCLAALAQIVAFATGFVVLTYAVATFAMPLVDGRLAAFDAACGVNVPRIRQWAEDYPKLSVLLRFAYDTLLYQTAAVIGLLGLRGDRRRLESFVLAFMLAAVMALVLFTLMPANGPFVNYRFPASADQERFLEHFRSLREGSRILVSYRGAEGLITFPSFHVAWALLLTWAFRGHWRWFAAFAVLNSLVVVSTMTTGWHYFADVLGGAAVALAASIGTIALSKASGVRL